jgi:SAM-dependent methyltransferase
MELKELQKNWHTFGKTDPLWAILTLPGKSGGKWDPEEFFATGRTEIAADLRKVKALGIRLRKGRALDFGCGVGRLTQALCRYFGECHGVDIAPSMIELARKYNRYGSHCHYHLNETDSLAAFADGTFDYIHSCIVLQHMEPRYSKNYLREFLRLLAPGGVLVFQIPSHMSPPAALVTDAMCRARVEVKEASLRVPPAAPLTLHACVTNAGTEAWPPRSWIRLGGWWRDASGARLRKCEGRAEVPGEVAPGQQVHLDMTLPAPDVPGAYTLVLDIIQEDVVWFADRGSPPCLIPVTVDPAAVAKAPGGAPAAEEQQAVMEMYGVKPEEVRELIAAGGGQVVHLEPDDASPVWVSYHYFVVKQRRPFRLPLWKRFLRQVFAGRA